MSASVNVYKAISVPWRQLVEHGSKAQALAVAFLPTSFILLRWRSLSACNVPSPGLMWDREWALACLWGFLQTFYLCCYWDVGRKAKLWWHHLLSLHSSGNAGVLMPGTFFFPQRREACRLRTSLLFALPLAGLSALSCLFDLVARGSLVTWLSIAETDRSDFCGRHTSWLCTAQPELSCFDSSLPGISSWPTNRWHTATLFPLSCPVEVQAGLTQDLFCHVPVYLPYCSALRASSGEGFLGRGDEKAWCQQNRRWESGEREAADSFI